MPATRLVPRRVAKPWGRHRLWPAFADVADDCEPIGEIWFETPDGRTPELLVKWLFTGERLSIQVHPDDAAAQRDGHPRGKDEAWLIIAAEPDARIALGPKAPLTREGLRAAALDGALEAALDWRPVRAGDSIYSPAGTIHAMGAGLTLVEVQQNVDLTYRLYDYGRPRALHPDEAVAAADLAPFRPLAGARDLGDGRTLLAGGPKFALERWRGPVRRAAGPAGAPCWFAPVGGEGCIDGEVWRAGECWLIEGPASIELGEEGDALFAYAVSGE